MKATVFFRAETEPSGGWHGVMTYGYTVEGTDIKGAEVRDAGTEVTEHLIAGVTKVLKSLSEFGGPDEVEVLFSPSSIARTVKHVEEMEDVYPGAIREFKAVKAAFRKFVVDGARDSDTAVAEQLRVMEMQKYTEAHPEFFAEYQGGLATEKQKALLTKWSIPFHPWLSKKGASQLITDQLRGWLKDKTNQVYVYKQKGTAGTFQITIPAYLKFGPGMRYVMTFDFEPEHYQHILDSLSKTGGRTITCDPDEHGKTEVYTWAKVEKDENGQKYSTYERHNLPECCAQIIREKIIPVATLMSSD